MTRREIMVTIIVIAAAVAILPFAGGAVLWTRPLWFDELCCVSYVVGDAGSPAEVVRRVAGSWDYAPPLLHLLIWPVAKLAGAGVTPELLRSVSLAAVLGALFFVYANLRRIFAAFPSAAGTLAVAGHSLVIAHAFEGRFYGPWLLLAAGYVWSLGVAAARRRAVAQAVFSVLLVGIHWFAVLSLGLMLAGALMALRGPLPVRLRYLAPSAAGIVAFVALLPMAMSQRSQAVGYLWLPALNGAQVLEMSKLFWLAAVPLSALVVLVGRHIRRAPPEPRVRTALREPATAAMVSLALMPVALMVLSAMVQPSMLDRYGIVAALAWAPLAALALTSITTTARIAAAGALALVLLLNVERLIAARSAFATDVAAMSGAFDAAKSRHLPVVFWGLHSIYPVAGPVRQRTAASPARYLDLPDSTLTALFPGEAMEPVRKKYRLDRDQARGHARTYGFPVLVTQTQLDTTPRFLLIAAEGSLPGGYKRPEVFGQALFPAHRVSRIDGMLSLFERASR
jgi:hypothetical protein